MNIPLQMPAIINHTVAGIEISAEMSQAISAITPEKKFLQPSQLSIRP